MPIRSFGTFTCKVTDYDALIDKVAGIKLQFTVEEVKERITSMLDQLLMKWIAREGKDMFNLQVNAAEIGRGIQEDLDMDMQKIGITISSFAISSFNYPPEIQKMAEKVAAQSMIGDMGRFQQASMAESMMNGRGGGTAADMAGISMGMAMGQQMVSQMNRQAGSQPQMQPGSGNAVPNFCPNCGTRTNGANFCANCGQKLI